MNARKTYGFILAGYLSANVLVLSTSVPASAENPYRGGHRAAGSFAKQGGNQRMTSAQREKEAQRLAHRNDRRVESKGTFVQHPSIPQSGVDQKGGVYDSARRDNPEVQHPVNTPRQNPKMGSGKYTTQPVSSQQQPFNIQPKQTDQSQKPIQRGDLLKETQQQRPNQQEIDQEKRRQALFDKFDAEYVANCQRTRKPDCTPPPHPTSTRGTTAYIENNS